MMGSGRAREWEELLLAITRGSALLPANEEMYEMVGHLCAPERSHYEALGTLEDLDSALEEYVESSVEKGREFSRSQFGRVFLERVPVRFLVPWIAELDRQRSLTVANLASTLLTVPEAIREGIQQETICEYIGAAEELLHAAFLMGHEVGSAATGLLGALFEWVRQEANDAWIRLSLLGRFREFRSMFEAVCIAESVELPAVVGVEDGRGLDADSALRNATIGLEDVVKIEFRSSVS
jgi:hypothetical protein